MEKKNLVILSAVVLVILGALGYAWRDKIGTLGWSKKPPEILVVGVWRSASDIAFTREFGAFGDLKDERMGSNPYVATGTWAAVLPAQGIPFSVPIEEGATDLVLMYGAGISTNDLSYIRIRELTQKKLILTDLKTGETTEFERVK